MNFARAFLQLVLCAVLFVTTGFAATKKIQADDPSRDGNDWSFRAANLLDAGGGVPSGGSGNWLSNGGPSGPPLLLGSPGTPDNWTGGTGNWSNAGNWSSGLPGNSSDVTIYSGSNDTVTLDTSPKISSLTLGGASNGTTSELTDGGVAQTLTITKGLTVGQTGTLNLTGGSTVTVGAGLSNAGMIDLESTLSVTGNLTNSGRIIFLGALRALP